MVKRHKRSFKRAAIISILTTMSLANPSQASDLCENLNILMDHARTNFSMQEQAVSALPKLGAPRCRLSRNLSGTKTYHCALEFPYRDTAAGQKYTLLTNEIETCLGPEAKLTKDKQVNHPDFYDQNQYQLDVVRISASIKDKGALQKTLIFISLHLTQ